MRFRSTKILQLSCVLVLLCSLANPIVAQSAQVQANAESDASPVTGFVIDLPRPLTPEATTKVLGQLQRASRSAPDDRRVTVVMRYRSTDASVSDVAGQSQRDETAFEDALRLARAMTGSQLRSVRTVTWIDRGVSGHSILPVIASDLILVGPGATLGGIGRGEAADDDTLELNYQAIARRRGLFPPGIVKTLVDPNLELAVVTQVGGEKRFLAGQELSDVRAGGQVLQEEVWSRPSEPLSISGTQLRQARIASARAATLEDVLDRLDLASVVPLDGKDKQNVETAVLLEMTGAIAPTRSRRWQSNLSSTLSGGQTDAWLISMDSTGGSLDSSATLAAWFADPPPPLLSVAGYVRGEARGDASLIALACKPLTIHPDARLGGLGGQAMSLDDINALDETITQIARQTNRPVALIRGLLCPDIKVYRYTNRKTGRVLYATPADLGGDLGRDEPGKQGLAPEGIVEQAWQQGEQVELSSGLSASQAVTLGLAEGTSASLSQAARTIGLNSVPPPVVERTLVRWVERLGRSTGLSFLLLFIGFAALSSEANAPGLSVPGFVAMMCFAMFFWMKFLAGTAEWFELLALVLGLVCIAIEIFVVPGFGVFGIGGLALTVLGIVLMSQTFVIPQNIYQIGVFTRGIWGTLFSAAGVFGGFLIVRYFFPHLPVLGGLVMETPGGAEAEQNEMLVHYENLLGQTGRSTTPLRPSGKAKIGDQIVQVISDGTMIDADRPVTVCEVHASRVIVEQADAPRVIS